MRRPDGDQRVGSAARCGERVGSLVARGLERVDAQIERRAARERRALRGPLVAEHARKMRIEPFRIVAGDMRRRAVEEIGRTSACARLRQRLGRKAPAVGKPRDRLGIEPALEPQHAEQRPRAASPRP